MDLVAQLGRNVRAIRISLGLSQEELAFRAGMKRTYLSDLERGVRNPTVRAVERLALAMEVAADQLLLNDAPNTASK